MPLVLPEEKPAPVRRAQIRRMLLATAGCVVGINLLLVWLCGHSSVNLGTHVIRHKWKLLETLDKPVDWLIVGDSGGTQGVDPAVFDQALGTSSINLCMTGGALALNDAWLLEAYIRRFGPPQNVLVVHSCEVWERGTAVWELSQVPLGWGFWDRVEPHVELTWREKAKLALYRYVPLYSSTVSVARMIREPWSAFRGEELFSQRGFLPRAGHHPEAVARDVAEQLEHAAGREFSISRENRAALARIAELAEQHRFEVYLACGPIYDGLYRTPEFQRYFAGYEHALRAAARTSPRLHVLPLPAMTFPLERMADTVDHVLADAAPDYTARLAELIRAEANASAEAVALSPPDSPRE